MDLPSACVYQALVDNGADSIHHANTVVTACHFIRAKALLSRVTTESRGLKQTAQYSDDLDKRHSIWFDVFTDSVDIHARAKRANHYGPVLFVFDAALIEKAYTGRVWVTKTNPTKWKGQSAAQRWFQSKEDLETNFSYGTFDHMIVFRHSGGELPFKGFLKEIVLDDPGMETTTEKADLFSIAFGALRSALNDAGLDVPIKKRSCSATCRCGTNYSGDPNMAWERFVP